MAKRVVVISLGGSLIAPNKIDAAFLHDFKKIILKNTGKYKFVIVCGGGGISRAYMNALEKEDIKKKEDFMSFLGISITRLNARLVSYFFGKDAFFGIPHDMKHVRNMLRINDVVFCGGLRYKKSETSDATSAKLARYFDTAFINLTNVNGLYDKDPKKFRKVKFIPEISHKDFLKIANKIRYKPGQHFVLDQKAAKIIKKYSIQTYIIGSNMDNFDNLLNKRHFVGTKIG